MGATGPQNLGTARQAFESGGAAPSLWVLEIRQRPLSLHFETLKIPAGRATAFRNMQR